MARFQYLPQELFDLIFDNFRGDVESLAALSLTSHSLHDHANRALYYKIITYSDWSNNSHEIQRKFLRTITSSQVLADLVRVWGFSSYELPEDLFALVASGLAAMSHLKHLWFGFDFEGCPSLLKGATFQLHSLRWSGSSGKHKEFLCDWLKSQSTLTEIYFDPAPLVDTSLKLGDVVLPNLVRLRGSHQVLTAFLIRCTTVTEVVWTFLDVDYPIPVSPRLLPCLKQLRKLVVGWPQASITKLPDLGAHTYNLEVLEILQFDHAQLLLENLVATLPKLRWVVIHLNRMLSRGAIARALFRSNSDLRYVSVEAWTDTCWAFCNYEHFQRDLSSTSVNWARPNGISPWYWGLNDDGYLQEEWNGF